MSLTTATTIDERFWSKVNKTSSCWEWTAQKDSDGYGRFWLSRSYRSAHRLAYEWATRTKIPMGMLIDHKCHRPSCVNPAHLRIVDHVQNGQNTKSLRRDNTTGYRGVWWEKRLQKWRATATYKGKLYSAGYFDDLEDAGEAARQLRLKLYTHNDADRRKETNT